MVDGDRPYGTKHAAKPPKHGGPYGNPKYHRGNKQPKKRARQEARKMRYGQCGNCQKMFPETRLHEIKRLWERVEAGEEMPLGECPECGALVHLIDETTAANVA